MDEASLKRESEFVEQRNIDDSNDVIPSASSSHRTTEGATAVKKRTCLNSIFTIFGKWNSSQEVIDYFGHNTTLLGILHIYQRRNLFWTVAYLVCLGLSIFQTWFVTLDYVETRTKQSFSVENGKILPFPSVTICNSVVLPTKFNMSSIPGYSHVRVKLIDTCGSENAKSKREERKLKNQRAIIKFRRSLNERERMRLSGKVESFISKCTFNGEDCKDFNNTTKYFIFNNPFYGTCATFNPAFDESTAMKESLTTRLRMEIVFPNRQQRLTSSKRNVVVRIHTPGTAAILEPALLTNVNPGKRVTFNLKLDKRTFLPRPNDPMGCIDIKDLTYRKNSIYYTDHSPYLYSVKNCMKSCEQRYLQLRCNESEASSPVPSDDEERKRQADLYTVSLHADSCDIPENLDMKFCNCPLSCIYNNYLLNIDDSIARSACREGTEDALLKAYIVVLYETHIYENVEEEIIINLSTYLGILGGNMNFGIGLCVLSALELFELFFHLTLFWVEKGCVGHEIKTDNDAIVGKTPNTLPTTFSSSRQRTRSLRQIPFL